MAGFQCPFCGEFMSIHERTHQTWHLNFSSNEYRYIYNSPHLMVEIFRCPNDDCNKESIYAKGINNYIDNASIDICPQCDYEIFPDYVPAAIRSDYEEACAILKRSPKAAATLARRCLQGMIHDFWDIRGKNLNAEITQLKDLISASQWKAIDAVRSIGNIGAHMEHDVNKIIDVDPDEAGKLIRLIEHLIEKWYIDRHDEEELYAELADISQEKAEARKS